MDGDGGRLASPSASLFAALGLSPSGPLDDATLRRAFTAAARRSHPDKQRRRRTGAGGEGGGGGDGLAASARAAPATLPPPSSFADIRAAYEALLSPADRARHASAARSEGGCAAGGGGGRIVAAPAEVDLDDFRWEEGGGGGEGKGARYWLACRCGGRHAVPEADLAAAAAGGTGRGRGLAATILVPCDGCSLAVRAHFCCAEAGEGGEAGAGGGGGGGCGVKVVLCLFACVPLFVFA